jgi:hypothetical protein
MKIDTLKLKNLVPKKDGSIEAQCPACFAAGHDKTGNHLIVYPGGEFGCVANQGDSSHNKEILDLVGVDAEKEQNTPKVTVRPFKLPPSRALMTVPRRTLAELGLKQVETPEKQVKK